MRAFVAVWPPEEVVATVAALERPELAGVRWTRREQWHVTVRFLGSVPEPDVQTAAAALEHAAQGLPPPDAVLGPVTECFGRHLLHVPVAGLDTVAAAVTEATADIGEPPEDRPFRGHVTLARTTPSRGGSRRRGPDLRPLAGAPVTARWPVRELVLVRSHPDPGGSRYEVLHRVELGGR